MVCRFGFVLRRRARGAWVGGVLRGAGEFAGSREMRVSGVLLGDCGEGGGFVWNFEGVGGGGRGIHRGGAEGAEGARRRVEWKGMIARHGRVLLSVRAMLRRRSAVCAPTCV